MVKQKRFLFIVGIDVKGRGIHIDFGFHILGDAHIFEFIAPAKLTLLRDRILWDSQLIPINIMNGLVQVRSSRSELNKGPHINIDVMNEQTKVSQ